LSGRPGKRRARGATVCVALACAVCAIWAVPCSAVIHPVTIVAGAANNVLEVDGAAFAPDGSGGVLYRARGVDGLPHVYVEQFLNGQWSGPIQVDGADPYGASTPAIAAGDHGVLLVVWVQPRAVSISGVKLYSLMAAFDQPGASGFGLAVTIDPNVSEPYNGDISPADPQLAMDAASEQAYVVYRVSRNDCTDPQSSNDPPSSLCLPGDELLEVRVARFSSPRWNLLGAVNRAPTQVALRAASASNRPSIGIDEVYGNALVAWQEPDSSGVARIWARRIFGQTLGNVLAVSPTSVEGKPLGSDAEDPVVAVSPHGEARVAFRIGGAGAAPPRLYLNTLGSALGFEASQFKGAVPLANLAGGDTGAPGVAIDGRGDYRLAWMSGQTLYSAEGNSESSGAPVAIGPSAGGVSPTTIDPVGGSVTSWLGASPNGAEAVDVRQDLPDGDHQLAQLAGTLPGAIAGLSMAGSGKGDALLGWTEGQPGRAQVVVDFVQAPPAPFHVLAPRTWVAPDRAAVSWEAAPDAVTGVRYTVYVDGRPRIGGLSGLTAALGALALGDGRHIVQVLATDASGQHTLSDRVELRVDASPPLVRVRLIDRDHGVLVTATSRTSGVSPAATRIAFGDGRGSSGHARARHRYARGGTYTIVARVRDRAGRSAVDRIRVRIA
jgi:hypothetical protein